MKTPMLRQEEDRSLMLLKNSTTAYGNKTPDGLTIRGDITMNLGSIKTVSNNNKQESSDSYDINFTSAAATFKNFVKPTIIQVEENKSD